VPTRIAWIGCNRDVPTGLYTPRDFAEGKPAQDPGLTARPALAAANVVLHRGSCALPSPEVGAAIGAGFTRTVAFGDLVVYVRRGPS